MAKPSQKKEKPRGKAKEERIDSIKAEKNIPENKETVNIVPKEKEAKEKRLKKKNKTHEHLKSRTVPKK